MGNTQQNGQDLAELRILALKIVDQVPGTTKAQAERIVLLTWAFVL